MMEIQNFLSFNISRIIFTLSVFIIQVLVSKGSLHINNFLNIKENIAIKESSSTKDVSADSFLSCASLCVLNTDCCAASYRSDSICRFEMSTNCQFSIDLNLGAVTAMPDIFSRKKHDFYII